MPRVVFLFLYGFTILYAVVSYLLRQYVEIATILIGFGMPILLYLALEYIATPVIACIAGFYARWSIPFAVIVGYPLVILATVVFPVGNTKSNSLPVPVPWLAAYSASKDDVMREIPERLLWWTSLFLIFLIIGLITRWIVERLSERRKNEG
jgi:hypothetical protein